jgi:thioredoxin-like negative regulator of GroEL
MALPVITEQDFEREVLRSELPVLVFFFSELSEASKVVAPDVEAVAAELEGKAKVVKVDAERSKRLAMSVGLKALPTFMVIAGGQAVAAESGIRRRKQLRAMLEPYLPRAEGAIRAVELAQAMKQGQVVAIDTRDAGSFGRAHIPGATNMPLEEIPTRLAELLMLAGAPILYCRSGDKAKETSDKLAEDGMSVGFLEGGFLAWEAEGLPIERS